MTERARAMALWAAALLLALTCVAERADAGKKDDDDDEQSYGYSFSDMALAPAPRLGNLRMKAIGGYGVTPGGAQDIAFARTRILAGQVPHPNTFTAEGLLSRYDLPLPATRPCKQTICLTTAAVRADLVAQPEVRFIAQLGFSSGLDPRTFRRDPVNLVAVVDKSGSMSGEPIETVRASLHHLVRRLRPRDQLSIVLYGDTAAVHLRPTSLRKPKTLDAAIDAIAIAGSTAMERGLAVGFALARSSAKRFAGRTRVMLFTDERPNVGATDAHSFMGMARAASKQRVGLTTIGVGTQFGAELATRISSVRGGNLFFFPDAAKMTERFDRDLDTMITELGYDMKLVVEPRQGYRLVGLWGLPGDAVERTKTGGLEMTVETLFLSKERGGIYFGFAPATGGALPPRPGALAEAAIHYLGLKGRGHRDRLTFTPIGAGRGTVPLGLARGLLLVDEVTAFKKAAALHNTDNDQEAAFRLVRALDQRFKQSGVGGLEPERALVAKLLDTFTRLSGHRGEPGSSATRRDLVSGLPVR